MSCQCFCFSILVLTIAFVSTAPPEKGWATDPPNETVPDVKEPGKGAEKANCKKFSGEKKKKCKELRNECDDQAKYPGYADRVKCRDEVLGKLDDGPEIITDIPTPPPSSSQTDIIGEKTTKPSVSEETGKATDAIGSLFQQIKDFIEKDQDPTEMRKRARKIKRYVVNNYIKGTTGSGINRGGKSKCKPQWLKYFGTGKSSKSKGLGESKKVNKRLDAIEKKLNGILADMKNAMEFSSKQKSTGGGIVDATKTETAEGANTR